MPSSNLVIKSKHVNLADLLRYTLGKSMKSLLKIRLKKKSYYNPYKSNLSSSSHRIDLMEDALLNVLVLETYLSMKEDMITPKKSPPLQ